MPKEKIFLSAVTGQFKACRDALRSDLAAVRTEVVVQEDFTQHGGTLLEKLEEYIASCDRVIALVGTAYGWEPEPQATPEGKPSRSYTQWEYYFARGERLDGRTATAKPIYVYVASPTYLENHPIAQSETAAARQLAFIDELFASGIDRNTFDSIDQLGRLVLRNGFRLPDVRKYLINNLPYDSLGPLFKGRDEVIADIEARISASADGTAAIVAKQAIHGLGGIGKSRLAIEYAWRHVLDYAACLFVIADSRENLERNLAALCDEQILKLPERTAEEQDAQVAAVRRWLGEHPGWLLILDNVDSREAAETVGQLLPRLQSGHVLITSRRTDWEDVSTLSLDTLNEDAATAFLLEKTQEKRSTNESDADTARTLARTLAGLALALEQAGAFINKNHLSFLQYQERWARQEAKLRDFSVKHYSKSLAVTWETSFGELTPEAQALLNLLCWFAPDPIPREPFESAFDAETLTPILSTMEIEDAPDEVPPEPEDFLAELETVSLLKWESGYGSFSVHRLVQEITRNRLTDAAHSPALGAALDLVNHTLFSDNPPPDDVRAWPLWERMRPHVEIVVRLADEAGIAEPTALLLNQFGLYLSAKGLKAEAEALSRRSLEICEKHYGSDSEPVAARLNNIGLLLRDTNRLKEAESLLRRALEIRTKNNGPEHGEVAICLNNLAMVLLENHRLQEAEPLIRRAVAIDKKNFGPRDPAVATGLGNLASVLYKGHRYSEAESLIREALEIGLENDGPAHPNLARRQINLATVLRSLNRPREAESLYRQALAIDVSFYGSEHYEVAIDMTNLSELLRDMHRLSDALPLSRRAVETFVLYWIRNRHEHPAYQRALRHYLNLLTAMGYDEAQQKQIIKSLSETVQNNAKS